MKIALISCSKSKQQYSCTAKEMYQPSNLFALSYKYAKLNADKIYILSAKYGLLHEEQQINPYNITLKTMPENRQKDWANYVIRQMDKEFDLQNDQFIILAGKDYYKNLLPALRNYNLPLGNRPLGSRISFLQNYLLNEQNSDSHSKYDSENLCNQLHSIFNGAKQYNYEQINQIPFNNGIYIMFEKNEYYGEMHRIVRIGTHTSQNRLKQRLKDHFISENKDGSIFRKNIGKALLNSENNPYLKVWNLDSRKPEYIKYVNYETQKEIENQVTEYLQNNITFTAFRVDDAACRLRIENGIIASLNKQNDFGPNVNWLGNFSTEIEIRQSGMWLKRGLDDIPLSQNELEVIVNQLNDSGNPSLACINKSSENNPSDFINNKPTNVGTKEIKRYILSLLEDKKRNGYTECVLISGDIHKQMKLSNKMPSVCSAMYQLMKPADEVLKTTTSGKSSTITIRYKL